MAYDENFSLVYDRLMTGDIDYPAWTDHLENLFAHYDISPELICDLACGTGGFTIELARRGYNMTGVDISADMLNIAKKKAVNENFDILFLNQSLPDLDLYGSMDVFLCMIDGFNYILIPEMLQSIFSKIHRCFMNKNGILIFDLSSGYKLKNIIGNNIFLHNEKNIFYAWDNIYHEKTNISEMNLTFFEKKKYGYKRFEENHLQKAYAEKDIVCMLKKAGFSSADTFDGYTFSPPDARSERIVFAAKY